jgi:UDP-glucose 4-epimerase
MKKDKIIIFGASGFIGTYLIDSLLNKNYQVLAIDSDDMLSAYYLDKKIEFLQLDLRDSKKFNEIDSTDCTAVIQLAALQPSNYDPTKHSPKDYLEINAVGTLNVLEFCKNRNIPKIIYAMSHRNTSGHWGKMSKVKESDGISQEYFGEYSMFSIAESCAHECVKHYSESYNINSIVFRLPPVYGYGPHLDIFKGGTPIRTGFQTFIDRAILGKAIEVWGDPHVGRDIIYVKDVISAFICAITSDSAKGLYNISSNYSLTLLEEIKTTIEVFNQANNIELLFFPEKTNFIDCFVYDNSKAKLELNWTPKYNFKKMLIDYKKEKESNKFSFLIKKRKKMFDEYGKTRRP